MHRLTVPLARVGFAALAGLLVGLLLPGCGTSAPDTELSRPPTPRLDEPAAGRDPIADAQPRAARTVTPTPPVADAGPTPTGSGLPTPAGRDAELYVIGGRPLTAADLGDFLLRYFPDRAREPLGQLVDELIVEHEAAREGVTVAPDLIRARADAYIDERRREVRVQYGADVTLESLLESSFGRTLTEFRTDAERLARVGLLRDRLVRLEQRREDRVEVRALTFADEEDAHSAVERLRSGADMTLLAQRLGIRAPSAPPPLGRADIRPAARSTELFAAPIGAVLEPRAFKAPDGSTWWEVIKVAAAAPGDARPWSALEDEIESSLVARTVGVPEYLAWRRRSLRHLGVEVRREGRGLVRWIDDADSSAPTSD